MKTEEALRKLEGLHTIETAMDALGMKRQSALNLLCRLKKEGYVRTQGGHKQKRWYWVSMKKQYPRSLGMFDILNRHNPHFQIAEWYDHQVHGHYSVEDVIVDAVQTRSSRPILTTLRLFNSVADWKRLYELAKEKGCWQQVGALYDLARMHLRVRRIPRAYAKVQRWKGEWKQLTMLRNRDNFPEIQEKWGVHIPFNRNDVAEVA